MIRELRGGDYTIIFDDDSRAQNCHPRKALHHLENLGNVGQTRWDPILLPTRSSDGRWTVDVWAPLEGRVINGGARFMF
jgi:hypothetical protein